MPLCYSAHSPPHEPAALGVQSDYSSPETAPNSYPRYNTLFRATFVLGPTQKLTGSGWNRDPKTAEFQFENRIGYAKNRSNPTQQAARA
ncbi:hypothetical protein L3X38_043904 [Prunus dulcis]|uniref:Uncharacterized protein n=1 Tax=Prunus dulcis TaxID=3755 RepID=A0AAD4UYN9_PRUDU|nr:hypothetical protein L3X38_043904 [Prunus dulcis]